MELFAPALLTLLAHTNECISILIFFFFFLFTEFFSLASTAKIRPQRQWNPKTTIGHTEFREFSWIRRFQKRWVNKCLVQHTHRYLLNDLPFSTRNPFARTTIPFPFRVESRVVYINFISSIRINGKMLNRLVGIWWSVILNGIK